MLKQWREPTKEDIYLHIAISWKSYLSFIFKMFYFCKKITKMQSILTQKPWDAVICLNNLNFSAKSYLFFSIYKKLISCLRSQIINCQVGLEGIHWPYWQQLVVGKWNLISCCLTFPYGWVTMAIQLSQDRKLLTPGDGECNSRVLGRGKSCKKPSDRRFIYVS